MAFGKRSAGDVPAGRPSASLDSASDAGDTLLSSPDITAVRTRVTNPGGFDRSFAFLAAGVVVFAAGAAFAAPTLLSAIGVGAVRPIEQVVAGLDRQGARAALATEAFPDADGRAFMTSLAANFPNEHGRLLDTLTDAAMTGSDRDKLYAVVNDWSLTFAPGQMAAIGRTGARGFDEGVTLLTNALELVESEVPGCTGAGMQKLAIDEPNFLARLTKYDGRGYHYSMRAGRAFVELAAAGRSTRAFDVKLTANDNSAIQSAFFSMITDPQVSTAMQMAITPEAGMPASRDAVMNKLNFCQLGRTVLIKMKNLPEGTKSRLFGTLMSQDLRQFTSGQGFSGPTGGLPLSLLSAH